ncbi:hypothetical protein IL992_22870 [Microbispora sp. NEAU-D428]|uniref:hypothetical protein n=1 Tax=Microbispora sitophila TaxID=2771537 RepID=UPI001868CF67|nr:hypothetical protein [Microbispora sitophila]MBE3012019.1 hypothetical protein [Microbispora sitophila]
MLCTYCGGDTVPDWVVCPLCGAEGSDARPAPTATAPPPLRPGRIVDLVVSTGLLVGAAVFIAGIVAAPLLRDDWYAVLFASSLSPLPLAAAAGLLWFTRTAATGAGIAVAHLVVAFSPSALPALWKPPPNALIIDSLPLQLGWWIMLVVLAASSLAWHRTGRFTWRRGGRARVLLGVLPLVYLAGEWLPETATPVVGFGGRDYAACCFMFNDPSRAFSDWIVVGMAIGAVVMTALAGLVANRRLAGGLILGAVSAVMPPLVASREEGTMPLPGFWIALAAVAAMTALALMLLARKETDHPSSQPLPGHSPRGLSDRAVAFFLRR